MRTIEKGNKLEDEFYEYLLGQQDSGELVFDAYPPQNCKIFKKKKYLDPIGNRQVEFDVVVELVRPERTEGNPPGG